MPKRILWSALLILSLSLVLFLSCDNDDEGSDNSGSEPADVDTADDDAVSDDDDDNDFDDDDDNNDSIPFPGIDWANLTNPILARDDRMHKDQSVVYFEGKFFIFASARFHDDDPNAELEGKLFYTTTDFKEYEHHYNGNITDLASPDVIYADGGWHMIVQQNPYDDGTSFRRLYHSRSDDLIAWYSYEQLAPDLLPDIRSIDGAMAWHDGYYYLVYKATQIMVATRSMSRELDGRWLPPRLARPGGSPVFYWAENYQLINVDGVWRMIATGRDPDWDDDYGDYNGDHAPYIYTMNGDGSDLANWADWTERRLLDVPQEGWNTITTANTAYLCDWREYDGWFYLFYAGMNDNTSFQGRGHGKIGVVRSKDLVDWKLPGDTSE